MRRLPEVRNKVSTSPLRQGTLGFDRETNPVALEIGRHGIELAAGAKKKKEKKWTATSTVKPLIISLVSHKSTDRAAVT